MRILKLLMIILLPLTFNSCQKDEIEPTEINSFAEDIKQIISTEGVQALQVCRKYNTYNCEQSNGYGTDFSFPGDNIVRIRSSYYNLNEMEKFKVGNFKENDETERRLVLYLEM